MHNSIATPDLSHLTTNDYENVYEPAEDSFLLLDALESEIDFIKKINPLLCVEVGSGSGVVLTGLAKALGPNCLYISTDINPIAAKASFQTGGKNNVSLEVINCDLVSPLQPRFRNKVDVLVFNPPYVPTDGAELVPDSSSPIALSWAGGPRGRIVMDRFFPIVPQLLSSTGVFYLLIVKENDEEDIKRIMASHGLKGTVVKQRRTGPEFLTVLKFVFDNNKVN